MLIYMVRGLKSAKHSKNALRYRRAQFSPDRDVGVEQSDTFLTGQGPEHGLRALSDAIVAGSFSADRSDPDSFEADGCAVDPESP
jgi:hypothetical protein